MKFFCVTDDPTAPSFRFRVTQHLAGLRERGLAPEVLPLPQSPWARWRAVRGLPPASGVLVHRAILSRIELAQLRRCGARLLYDFDQALTVRDPRRPALSSVGRRRRFARMVSAADTVLAGQTSLAKLARRWARSQVHVVPTTVDLRPYDDAALRATESMDANASGERAASMVVGWLGADADPTDLEELAPALRELTRRHAGLRLRTVGRSVSRLRGIVPDHRAWSRVHEADQIVDFDIGIAPLRDDAWGRGRCGTEVLQLQAGRRPVVCAPVGIHRELVVDGESGHFARDTGEWIDRLDRLLRSPEQRRRLGEAGRARLEHERPATAIIDRLEAALRG